ncbi:MAG: flagellar biosynthetic protein FliR [Planctomycetaceae bacterium]|nr:flagellar biosynthetic protein FliR [Planctomycetaceae bacterium]
MSQYTTWGWTLALLMARIGGLFVIAPVFSSSVLPARLRYLLCVALALGAAAQIATPLAMPVSTGAGLVALAVEALIGSVIGLAARALLSGIEVAAALIGQQMGLTLGQVYYADAADGEGGDDPLTRLMYLLGIVVFLAVGGHRGLLSGLMGTFTAVAPGAIGSGQGMLNIAMSVLAASFVMAIKIAAPVVVTLLVIGVVLAVVGRTMPQLNILTVGLPAQALVGLIALAGGLALMLPMIERGADMLGAKAAQLAAGG